MIFKINNISTLWKENVKKSIPFIGNLHYAWLANGMTSISWDNLIYKSDLFKSEIYESIMYGMK